MSVPYSAIIGGPAYATYNSKTIQFVGDTTFDAAPVYDDLESSLYGKIGKVQRDFVVKYKGKPRYYDTAQISTLFPYISFTGAGTVYPGSTALPLVIASNNEDLYTVQSAIIGKMPELTLGIAGPTLGDMEFWGVLPWGVNSSAQYAYYQIQTGQAYANPAVAGTAVIGEQEFTAAWGSVAGFTSFQAETQWTISHELELTPVVIQGRTRGWRVSSYRAMAKCKPNGPTASQIDAALMAQYTSAAAFGGSVSAGGGMILGSNSANLVLTGANSMTVTIGNAGMVGAGYIFSGKQLRPGEIGFISNLLITAGGSPTAPLALA